MSGLSRIRTQAARADKNKSVVDQGSVSPAQREDGPRHTDFSSPQFDYKQTKALQLFAQLDPVLKRGQIARAIGVSVRTLHNWTHLPGWYAELDRLIEANKPQLREKAVRTLGRVMDSPSYSASNAAAKIALQLTGDLSGDGVHVHQETNVAVGSLAERVNKYRAERGLASLSFPGK